MKNAGFFTHFQNVWSDLPVDSQKPGDIIYLVAWGFLIGLAAGSVISVFRITSAQIYNFTITWAAAHNSSWLAMAGIMGTGVIAALLVGLIIRNPAIRFGGGPWIREAMKDGQPHVISKILLPKFMGSWLVMAFGTSVGHEGPCIQMGAATALGLKKLEMKYSAERRFFILGGCAAGLSAAFSTPFAGLCYVYEIMKEDISRALFMFMLAGSFGVHVSCTMLFGLDFMLPVKSALLPDLAHFWLAVPVALFGAIVGIAYNYCLRSSIALYSMQRLLSPCFRPLASFLATALAIIFFPAVTGEGLTIYATLINPNALVGFLFLFLCVKLLLTAFSYGSGIPAGLMVPVLCLGAVAGGIFGHWLIHLQLIGMEQLTAFILMGMAACFAAAERAPVTAIVIVAQMTGAYELLPGLLLAAAIASLCGRCARVRSV